MDLVGDRRGQSIQIGAILLFAALIVAFASYQAFVVPNQNRGVEFNHNQQVQSDMQDLRNAIVSARGTGEDRSVSVQLGTRYPSRLVARNPSPPSGSLNTVGTTDDRVALRISNAQAAGETGDFWNQSQRYNTGGLTYRPNYNVYANPPTTIYEQTVLYNQFRSGNITLSNQSFIDGTDISLVAINGSVAASSTQATSVDVQSVSSSTERIRIENDDSTGPINITFTSQRSAAYWDFLVESQSTVDSVTNVSSGNRFYNVSVKLDPDRTYSLQLTKVGVGTGVTDEDAAYLTDIEGDGETVSQGETTELTLEVRDRFNNPPANRSETTVTAQVADSGSLDSTSQTPGEDGQVTFEYTAPDDATGEQDIEFTYGSLSDSTFSESNPQDVVMTVDVTAPSGGGGGGDGTSPVFSAGPAANPSTVAEGTSFDLTATIEDIGYGGSDIISVSWTDGQGNSGTFTADDGEFDQASESVSDTDIDTTDWETGDHVITVTGTDANLNDVLADVTVTIDDSGSGSPVFSSGPSANPGTVNEGDTFDLSATLDDTSSGSDDIASASWSDQQGNSGTLSADDGAFDEPTEAVSATIDTTEWSAGDHTITVTGTDAAGDSVAETVTVTVNNPTPVVNDLDAYPGSNSNRYDVDYDVTDSSSDLTSVTIILEDSSGADINSVEVLGPSDPQTGSVSGTETLQATGSNTPAQVRIVAEDASGNRVEQVDTEITTQEP